MSRWLGRVGSGGAGSSFGNLTVGGVAYFADGTAGAPSIAFSSDTDSGIWFDSPYVKIGVGGNVGLYVGASACIFSGAVAASAGNTWDIGSSGVPWKDFHLAGVAYIANGSAAAPSIAFSSDTDSGIGLVGGGLSFMLGGVQRYAIFSGGQYSYQNLSSGTANTYNLGTDGYEWKDIRQAGAHYMTEMTAPSGVANKATIYAVDNGSGKTQLMVIFGSGAAQQISIEP